MKILSRFFSAKKLTSARLGAFLAILLACAPAYACLSWGGGIWTGNGVTSAAPGSSWAVSAKSDYTMGECSERAQVYVVSGSCTTTAVLQSNGAACNDVTSSGVVTMDAVPTAPCVIQWAAGAWCSSGRPYNCGTWAGRPSGAPAEWNQCQFTSQTIKFSGQTITFTAPASSAVLVADYSPGATASTGLPVTYTSITPGVCTIVANKVHNVAAGTCTVNADQAGDATWTAAAQVQRSWTILPPPLDHFEIRQADTTTRDCNNVATKPITVLACGNTDGTCTALASGTASVTVTSSLSGSNSATTLTPLILTAGSASFNLKSSQCGQATLATGSGTFRCSNNNGASSGTSVTQCTMSFDPGGYQDCGAHDWWGLDVVVAANGQLTANDLRCGCDGTGTEPERWIQSNGLCSATPTNRSSSSANQGTVWNGVQVRSDEGGTGCGNYSWLEVTGSCSIVITDDNDGNCSDSWTTGNITMGSGTGLTACLVSYKGVDNNTYKTIVRDEIKFNQLITVTTHAPANAMNGSTFNVAATANSGLPVSITTSGSCSGSGASTSNSNVTITMTASSGACLVYFDVAATANYAAAPRITESTTATPPVPDHYEIVVPATSTIIGSTAALTVRACVDASCTSSNAAVAGTATLGVTNISGQTGTLSVNPVTLAAGTTAGLTMSDTLVGVTQLSVAPVTAPAAANPMKCYNGTTRDVAGSVTCNVTFIAIPDHYEIVVPAASTATGSTAALTVRACSDAACTSTFTGAAGTATLTLTNISGQTGTLSANPVTLVAGTTAGLTMSDTLVGVTQLSVAPTTAPAATNPMKCFDGTTRGAAGSATCNVTFIASADSFDAVETSITPWALGTSRLYTKLSGTAFDFKVVALSGGAIATSYTGTITVELIDFTSGACGVAGDAKALTGATVIFNSPANPYTYLVGDAGVKTFNLTSTLARPNVKFRISDGSITTCSTDNFSIRPGAITLPTAASASAPSSSATPVIKAGANFSLQALTSTFLVDGYAGTLTLDTSKLTAQITTQDTVQTSGGVVGTLTPATLTTNAAAVNATYGEVGYLYLAAGAYRDDAYTSVDQPNDCDSGSVSTALSGGKYGCSIGNSSVSFGRFIPDHLAISVPVLTGGSACGTNYGQDFTTAFTLTAQNAANATTQNYTGVYAALGLTTYANYGFTATYTPAVTATLTASTTAPSGTWSNGVANNISAKHFASVASPQFPASVAVSAQPSYTDNGTSIASAVTALGTSANMRSSILKLENAYGSERLPLDVAVQTLFWKPSPGGWGLNTLDSCTTIPLTSVMVGNFKGQLATYANSIAAPLATVTITGGRGLMRFAAPTIVKTGSFDIAVNLAAAASSTGSCIPAWSGGAPNVPASTGVNLTHLRGAWCGTTYNKNPSARVTFGVAKSPYLYRRERY